jgi:hypothetical protein
MSQGNSLPFVPSRVDGLPNVTEVVVYPDRLVLRSADELFAYPFADMASWPWPALFWRSLFRLGWRPRWLPVGERDWFHPPSERFFRFYTRPPVVIFMPDESNETSYGSTMFRRVQDIMLEGGFTTWDLG